VSFGGGKHRDGGPILIARPRSQTNQKVHDIIWSITPYVHAKYFRDVSSPEPLKLLDHIKLSEPRSKTYKASIFSECLRDEAK
jgi:hypothetical protein